VRERPAACLLVWAVALGVVAPWFALDGTDILRGVANIPSTHPFDDNVFGAHNLAFGLAAWTGLTHASAIALQILLLAMMLGLATMLARRMRVCALTRLEAASLLAGGAMLLCCFALAQNVSYRAIHLLFVLPALAAGWPIMTGPVLFLLWNSALRTDIIAFADSSRYRQALHSGYWLIHELAWWVVMTLLTGLLLRLAGQSRTVTAAAAAILERLNRFVAPLRSGLK
jgi:hypothetical protein